MPDVLSRCPACSAPLGATRLQCSTCGTAVEGTFQLCPFCRMGPEHREFALTFLRCRGNIKEVERELGISYPTVRGRLEELLRLIGEGTTPVPPSQDRVQVLQDLRDGKISQDEAMERLR